MWIKICGNTNLDDCLLAAELGADAVGFIFAHGKRLVTAERVAAITSQLPGLEKIGVFTTLDYDTIVRTVEEAGLTGVQMHGGPDYTLSERLRAYFGDAERCSVIQVLPWWTDRTADQQRSQFTAAAREVAEDGSADAMLIDSRTAQQTGGTGIALDWAAAHAALRGLNYRVIAAGGLHAGNVADAIEMMQPWGVDISSGVETGTPGRKDPARLQAFIEAARNAAARPLASADIR
ncbi:phosphoribosylanthranilate isomerase [Terriglobus aquaticus]|uniref:N-(5'-phosphoribosyl)anthranilate isomerase n=1 Tax=Terriglobus aquaticus TaxID=940139 RepID=A0ABW9KP22_9BACT|nr:phosphoribosylanthranilate isomerase [Terriglobus aquaticus]